MFETYRWIIYLERTVWTFYKIVDNNLSLKFVNEGVTVPCTLKGVVCLVLLGQLYDPTLTVEIVGAMTSVWSQAYLQT